MLKTTEIINKEISEIKLTVNGDFRQKYHMMPPVGWMNDPNGLVRFGGEYHLFYQFNPYAAKPGTMLWGHLLSRDLIRYTDAGAAIVPDALNASVYSGGAIKYGDMLAALYTRHCEGADGQREEVYMALSSDGINFGRGVKVFDNDALPENISRRDFRDPFPVKTDDGYYVFVGGKLVSENKGVIVVLGGERPEKLEYKFTIGPFYELGDMGECPCYRRIDGKDVIIASGCNVPARGNDFKNVNSSVFIVGTIDFAGKTFVAESIREIDKGDAFYAPQLINGDDRPVMVGWHEMWGKPYPTEHMNHGWAGCFTVPRVLSVRDGVVCQTPVDELDGYLVPYEGEGVPQCADVRFEFEGDGEVRFCGRDGSVAVGCRGGRVYLDTRDSNNMNGCVRTTGGSSAKNGVRVLLDVSGIEVFINGGTEAISSRIYIKGDLSLAVSGKAGKFEIKKVQV